MCGVFLKNRNRSEVLYILLGILSVAEVVTDEAWQMEVWAVGIWNIRVRMIGCWPVEMWKWLGGSVGAERKTWGECVNDNMKLLGLQPEWGMFRDMWKDFISGQT